MKVVANTVASAPIALSPLSKLPLGSWTTYAKEVFAPTPCKVTLDGMVLPGTQFTGVHVASMSINLGNVLRFFGKADQPGLMNAIVGTPTPWGIIRNLPRMARGQEMRGRDILDRPCREMMHRGDRRRAARADHRRRVLPQRQEARVPRRPARPDPEGRRAEGGVDRSQLTSAHADLQLGPAAA